jgi:hypothetical protein
MMISEEYEIREGIKDWLTSVREEIRQQSVLIETRAKVECIDNLIVELYSASDLGKFPWQVDSRDAISETNFRRRAT